MKTQRSTAWKTRELRRTRADLVVAQTFRQAQPFYVAADYHPPQPEPPGA